MGLHAGYCVHDWLYRESTYSEPQILAHITPGRKKDPFYRNIRSPIPPKVQRIPNIDPEIWSSMSHPFFDDAHERLAWNLSCQPTFVSGAARIECVCNGYVSPPNPKKGVKMWNLAMLYEASLPCACLQSAHEWHLH